MIGLRLRIIDEELIVNLKGLPERVQVALEEKMGSLMTQLRLKVVENLSGKVLNTKSGALASSLVSGVDRLGSTMVGYVEVASTDSKVQLYGQVHEYGGKGFYEIVPVQKKILRFIGKNGEVVFAPYVYHPPATERSYLRSALHEMAPEIEAELSDAIKEAMTR